jgi:Ca-activated chloride channel family protein
MSELEQRYEEAGISIFPVAYGEGADVESLERIAEFSRTMVVQGGTGDIAQIFENLSRYF